MRHCLQIGKGRIGHEKILRFVVQPFRARQGPLLGVLAQNCAVHFALLWMLELGVGDVAHDTLVGGKDFGADAQHRPQNRRKQIEMVVQSNHCCPTEIPPDGI